jgi:hypothetical protein
VRVQLIHFNQCEHLATVVRAHASAVLRAADFVNRSGRKEEQAVKHMMHDKKIFVDSLVQSPMAADREASEVVELEHNYNGVPLYTYSRFDYPEPYGSSSFFSLWVCAGVEYAVFPSRFSRAGGLFAFKWERNAWPCKPPG